MAKTFQFPMTPNVLIQINITILTCYTVVFKPAGNIKYAEAPVLLHFFEQQHILICECMESSETHHGQDTVCNFSILSSSYSPLGLHSMQMVESAKKVEHKHSKTVLIQSS